MKFSFVVLSVFLFFSLFLFGCTDSNYIIIPTDQNSGNSNDANFIKDFNFIHFETVNPPTDLIVNVNQDEGCYMDQTGTIEYQVFSYKTVDGNLIYSQTGINETIDFSNYGCIASGCTITVFWTDSNDPNVEGYRVLRTYETESKYQHNDTANNSLTDDCYTWEEGQNVSPNQELTGEVKQVVTRINPDYNTGLYTNANVDANCFKLSDGNLFCNKSTLVSWGGLGAIPSDGNGSIQYNKGGNFGGTTKFRWDDTNNEIDINSTRGIHFIYPTAGDSFLFYPQTNDRLDVFGFTANDYLLRIDNSLLMTTARRLTVNSTATNALTVKGGWSIEKTGGFGTPKTLEIQPNYPASGTIPAGNLITSQNTTGLTLIACGDGSSTNASCIMNLGYYNGTSWRRAITYNNQNNPDLNFLPDGNGTIKNFAKFEQKKDFNQSDGNTFSNSIYGEMFCKSNYYCSSFTFPDRNKFVSITGLSAGNLNGFSFSDNNLTSLVSGTYAVNAVSSIQASGNANYEFKVFVNDSNKDDCFSYLPLSNGSWGIFSATCLINLNASDKVTVRFRDDSNTLSTIIVKSVNINLLRVSK